MATKNQKIDRYILDSIDGSGYDVELTTDNQKIRFAFDVFRSEKPYNGIRYVSLFIRVADWLHGLPSVINIAFGDDEIEHLAKEFGILRKNASDDRISRAQSSDWYIEIAKRFCHLYENSSPEETII